MYPWEISFVRLEISFPLEIEILCNSTEHQNKFNIHLKILFKMNPNQSYKKMTNSPNYQQKYATFGTQNWLVLYFFVEVNHRPPPTHKKLYPRTQE